MEQLRAKFENEVFSLRKETLAELGILAVVIGGSSVYDSESGDPQDCTRDIDGAIIVSTTEDIRSILDLHRSSLRSVLKISLEEWPDTPLSSGRSSILNGVDAVRYSGFSADGRKRSFKIVSLDYFQGSARCMYVLSLKDRRVYEALTFVGLRVYMLQQATRLDSEWTVLHDPWLFEGQSTAPAFGVTADLLLTGMWLRGGDTVGAWIRRRLMAYAEGRLRGKVDHICFAKSDRFDPTFRIWLQTRFQAEGILLKLMTRPTVDPATRMSSVLLGPAAKPDFAASHLYRSDRRQISKDVSFCRTEDGSLALEEISPIKSLFSSNSTCRLLRAFVKSQTGPVESLTLFSKRYDSNSQQMTEMAKSLQAADYFPLVQIPLHEKDYLLYPVFSGRTEAETQLEYRRTGSLELFERILDVEMRKSEDILNAYRKSFRPATANPHHPSTWSIHQFFHKRLHKYRRMQQFYGSGIQINRMLVDFERLMELPVEINGLNIPCLSILHEQAAIDLHPSNLSLHPVVYGLGDAHGGNVMVGAQSTTSRRPPILYVDYEASGLHSALLDIAKPFYNDIFFDTLYADHLDETSRIRILIKDDRIHLEPTITKQQVPIHILQIKRHFLIEPLFSLASRKGINLDLGMPAFKSALFSCALCTRNYAENQQAFALSLYHAVMLQQANTMEELFGICLFLLGDQI